MGKIIVLNSQNGDTIVNLDRVDFVHTDQKTITIQFSSNTLSFPYSDDAWNAIKDALEK